MEKLTDLKCMGQINPLAIIDHARFSWKGIDGQTSVTLEILDGENIVYINHYETVDPFCTAQGFVLDAYHKYNYRVSVYIGNKKAALGQNWFISGKKNALAGVKWISDGRHFAAHSDEIGSSCTYYKKTFFLRKISDPAVITLCGLGLHELYINGVKADDRVLEPAFTEYDKKALYSSYDVTALVKTGENVIEIILGDGWYNQTTRDTWGFYRAPWREYPKLALRFDNENMHFESDESFTVSYGKIKRSALRLGEIIDFNAEYDYFLVCIVPPAGGEIEPSFLPPIRECEKIKPVAVLKKGNRTIYDFGVNMSGYASAFFSGRKGDTVNIEYSDRIKDGKCDNESNSMYIFNAGDLYQKDICILSGEKDFYKPKFVYHGFRYMIVSGSAKVYNVTAYFVHTDLARGGKFECSSQILNNLYEMSMRSILSNYHGFPTDCPHREKNGWTGDAQLSLETCIYNFNMHEAYEKWLDDIIVSQRFSGQIPAIVPTCGWGYNWGSGPAWDVAFFRVAHALYYYYGDVAAAEKAYPALKKYYRYISAYAINDLLSVGLGDWNYPKNLDFKICPVELTDSCYYFYMSNVLAEFSEIFSADDADIYRDRAKKTKKAIIAKYSDETSLTGLAALTYFGLIDKTENIAQYLKKNNHVLHTGILGAKFVFSVLGKAGLTDIGVKILSRTDYPSFGYWREHGQTTLCEDFELTNSLNHHMYSPIAEFMTRYICGVEIKQNGNVEFNPALPKNLDSASAAVTTAKGTFKIDILRKKRELLINVKIPEGAESVCCGKILVSGEHSIIIDDLVKELKNENNG